MPPILLNQLRNAISISLISFFCKRFEENEIAIRKSLDTSICTVLIGLENAIKNNTVYEIAMSTVDAIENHRIPNKITIHEIKTNEDRSIGYSNKKQLLSTFEKISDSIAQSSFLETFQLENGKISNINYSFEQEGNIPLHLIFSIKKSRISEMISNEVAVKSETASAVLHFAVLFILSHIKTDKQNATTFLESIKNEKTTILSALPEGIRVLLGYSNFEYDEENILQSNPLLKPKYNYPLLSKIFNF